MSQTASATSYTIQWTPPSDATGPTEVFAVGVSASGTRNTTAYTVSYTLGPAAKSPTLRSESPVVSLGTGEPEISGGALVAIHGGNLKADGETSTVRINGVEAALVASTATRIVWLRPRTTRAAP